MPEHGLTEQQTKWFASVRANLEANTGRTLEAWLEVARTAPAGSFRERVRWFKAEHGLLQNSASLVLSELDGSRAWAAPDAQRQALWTDPASTPILHAIEAVVAALDGVVTGQRKGYTAWSRKHQFAALRPVKSGGARLGLAVPPGDAPSLLDARNEGWSERLKSALPLASPTDVDDGVRALLSAAWARS